MYPELDNPSFGSFVAALNKGLRDYTGCEVDVLRREDGARGMGSYVGMTARGIKHSFAKRDYDFVHGHYVGAAAGVAWTVSQLLRAPLVLTAHGSDVEAAKAPATRLIQRQLYQRCAGLHFVSEPLRRRAEQLMGTWDAPTLVTPTGIPLDVFSPEGESKPPRTGRKRILMVGQTVVHKGWADALAALALLEHSGVDAELVAVGGDRLEWLRELADERGVADRLVCVGEIPHDDLPPYYRGADVVLVASHREGFGLVGLEAMACGTALVSTGVGGMRSYVRHQVNSLVGQSRNPKALATQLKTALEDPTSGERLIELGLETVVEYSVERSATTLVEFYRELLAHLGRQRKS